MLAAGYNRRLERNWDQDARKKKEEEMKNFAARAAFRRHLGALLGLALAAS